MINWFKGLPLWLQIIAIVFAIWIVYQIYSFVKRKMQAGNFNAAVNQSQTALNQLVQKGIVPSYSQAEYTVMANSLEQTFIGCGIGWSDVVVPTFERMKNDADVYALIKAYGVRNIDECGWGSFNGDLAATLSYKLSGIILTISKPSDYFKDASIRGINKILSNNGLTFRF